MNRMTVLGRYKRCAVVLTVAALALAGGLLLDRPPRMPNEKTEGKHSPAGHGEKLAPAREVSTRQKRPGELTPSLGWPNLFGPFHNSTSRETGVITTWPAAGPPEMWRRPIGAGYSAPVVCDDRVIVFHRQNDEELVQCLDAETGVARWAFAYPTGYECHYTYSSGPYSTPAVDESHVYTLGAEGRLHCLALADGQPRWSRALAEECQAEPNMFAVAVSPLVETDRLILNIGGVKTGAGIIAVDKQTGKTLWAATNQGASYASACTATIHGQRYAFVLTREGLVALDPASGHVWWSIPFSANNPQKENATSPVVYEDMVFVSAFCVGSLCVRVGEQGAYEELWRDRKVLDSQYNNLVVADGYVYGFASSDNSFRCVDMRTGRLCWKWRSRLGAGAALAVGDRFLLWGEKGRLGSLDVNPQQAALGSMTAKPLLTGPCFSAPALSRGLLYLRNEDTLLCLNLRSTEGERR